jgi:HTH-type transcriptional regulator/antitoxin HigA
MSPPTAPAFAPGEYLRDELEARGWNQIEFAQILGRPVRLVNQIITGNRAITPETAKELGEALGTSAELWMNLESAYRLARAEAPSERIALRALLRERAPVREMLKRGWIADTNDPEEMKDRVIAFLGIPSLDVAPGMAMAARKTSYGQPVTPIQEAWLTRAKQLARTVTVEEYTPERLEEAVEQFRTLLLSPDEARHVPKILAEAGVRFVVVESLPGLKLQAACCWLSANEPVIAMSMVRDSLDNFWFNLVHECDHVLNGEGKESPILDDDPEGSTPLVGAQEKRANRAASEFCVPEADMLDFMERKGPQFFDDDIRRFARDIGRSPAFVAGQLRRRRNEYTKYGKHLHRVRHIIVDVAAVDGFGAVAPI